MASDIKLTGASAPRGIVASTQPHVQIGLKQGDVLVTRPFDPAYVCMPGAPGSGYSMAQIPQSQFIIIPTNAPAGAPRIAGQWFKISLVEGLTPEGTREEVKLQSTAVVPGATPFTQLTFTVVAGSRVFN